MGLGLAVGLRYDHRALNYRWISCGRNYHVGACVLEVRRTGQGQRDEAELCVAGLGILGGLRDVLADDEARLQGVVELHPLERGDGGAAVGAWNSSAMASDFRRGSVRLLPLIGCSGESLRAHRTSVPFAYCVGALASVEVGGDELLGEGVVGGEEDVDGSAVLDLRGQRGGGAVADDELYALGLLVGVGEGRHHRLQVGGGGDAKFFLRLGECLLRTVGQG